VAGISGSVKARNLLSSWATIYISRSTLHHGVNLFILSITLTVRLWILPCSTQRFVRLCFQPRDTVTRLVGRECDMAVSTTVPSVTLKHTLRALDPNLCLRETHHASEVSSAVLLEKFTVVKLVKKLSAFLWNHKSHYHVHVYTLVVPVRSQFNPV